MQSVTHFFKFEHRIVEAWLVIVRQYPGEMLSIEVKNLLNGGFYVLWPDGTESGQRSVIKKWVVHAFFEVTPWLQASGCYHIARVAESRNRVIFYRLAYYALKPDKQKTNDRKI